MGQASEQELPLRPTEKSVWTMRPLFPFAKSMVTALAKNFINVFDVLLGFNIFILGLGELLNRDMSWFMYALTLPLLAAAFLERHFNDIKKS